MIQFKAFISKSGNSLVIVIPHNEVKINKLKREDVIDVSLEKLKKK